MDKICTREQKAWANFCENNYSGNFASFKTLEGTLILKMFRHGLSFAIRFVFYL